MNKRTFLLCVGLATAMSSCGVMLSRVQVGVKSTNHGVTLIRWDQEPTQMQGLNCAIDVVVDQVGLGFVPVIHTSHEEAWFVPPNFIHLTRPSTASSAIIDLAQGAIKFDLIRRQKDWTSTSTETIQRIRHLEARIRGECDES